MNILKDFDEFKNFCSNRWDTTDGKGFYCHHTNGSCNEHACFLLEHSCEDYAADTKESAHSGEAPTVTKDERQAKRDNNVEGRNVCTAASNVSIGSRCDFSYVSGQRNVCNGEH